ncbi:homeodomain protein [Pholiota molesta]|nr:homeodomain protein [Pholiota molesta]
MVSAASSATSALRIDFLRGCLSKAQELKELIEASQMHAPEAPTYNGPIPDLDLPFPHDIVLSVEEMGLPRHLCNQIKSKVAEKILESQRACTEVYQRTCRELPESIVSSEYLSNLGRSYQNFYNKHQLPKFRANILISKATLGMVSKHQTQESKRPTFNSEYTPILEKYFERNAYPSRPDRILLARKSSMSERQIEVWFQNHRNRAKKEGIILRRMSPEQTPLEFLEHKTFSHVVSSQRMPSSQNDVDIPDNHNETIKVAAKVNLHSSRSSSNLKIHDPLGTISQPFEPFPSLTPAPYTFPRPYQRNPTNPFTDPLPQQEGPRFPPPNWPRKPATRIPSPSSINMEEFITMFALKLSIRRGSGMKTADTSFRTGAWFSSRVTVPSPAPHPALIRVKALPRSLIPIPLLRTTAMGPNPSSTLSSTSQPPAKNAFKPRKTAPFPFRTPQKTQPQSIDTFLPVYQPFGSRTSSFASVSSSQSRSSSGSISSSPEPSTPPHSPTVNSHDTHKLVVQESTSDTYLDLFAGIVEPQFDLSQNFDYFLDNANIFTDKHPISMQNFPYLDPLFSAT